MDVVLVDQAALGKTLLCQNGQEKFVHAVVKRVPYESIFRCQNGTFKDVAVSARLVYDDRTDRDVVCQKHTPLTYQGQVCEDGSEYSLSATFGTLSSQHEDLYFRVCVEFKCKLSGATSVVFGHPVWVVSKPKVYAKAMERGLGLGAKHLLKMEAQKQKCSGEVKKERPKRTKKSLVRTNSLLSLKCGNDENVPDVGSKRKASAMQSDDICARLERIEHSIDRISKRQRVALPSSNAKGYERFSLALHECLDAYNSLSPLETVDHEGQMQTIVDSAAAENGQAAMCLALLMFGSARGEPQQCEEEVMVRTDSLLQCTALRSDSKGSLDCFRMLADEDFQPRRQFPSFGPC